jgi:hypothetical protein
MKICKLLLVVLCVASAAFAADNKSAAKMPGAEYLFVWAGDAARKASDFLAVVDANPSSSTYGRIVATVDSGETATMPHHTEYEFPSGGRLFANGWAVGHSYIFDLSNPLKPHIAERFTSRAGYSYPHSFARLPNGHVLATFQSHGTGYAPGGGLVELDQKGEVVRAASAVDPAASKDVIWPYSLAVSSKLEIAVSSLSPMGMPDWATLPAGSWPKKQVDDQVTSAVQVWRLPDLKLVKTVELPASGTKHNRWPAEPRLLPDSTVYVNTFSCGLYRMTGLDTAQPAAEQVFIFPGDGDTMMTTCGVPVVVGHYWVQTVAALPGLVVLDVTDAKKPVEVSRLKLDHERYPMVHWISADRKGDRLVVTGDNESWVLVVRLDPATGKVTLDDTFHQPGSMLPGISFEGAELPHGGKALVHGSLFGQ